MKLKMKQMYCPQCDNYLMGSSGECDCYCGWKQPEYDHKCDNCCDLGCEKCNKSED